MDNSRDKAGHQFRSIAAFIDSINRWFYFDTGPNKIYSSGPIVSQMANRPAYRSANEMSPDMWQKFLNGEELIDDFGNTWTIKMADEFYGAHDLHTSLFEDGIIDRHHLNTYTESEGNLIFLA